MKVSYNWLKDLLNFPYSPEELDAVLTETGLEVEGIEHIEDIKGGLKGVVVGEVLTCEKHPLNRKESAWNENNCTCTS